MAYQSIAHYQTQYKEPRMPDTKWYTYMSDEEVEQKIINLTPYQKKMYDIAMAQYDDKCRALFIASSYPFDYNPDK